MDHRLRIAHALSATATLGVAAVAFAAVDGGLFVHAAPATRSGAKMIEIVDDYIVVHSPTTKTPAPITTELTDAARLAALAPGPAPAPALVIATPTVAAPPPTPGQAFTPSDDEQSDEGGQNTMPGGRERGSDADVGDAEQDHDSDQHEREPEDHEHESEVDD